MRDINVRLGRSEYMRLTNLTRAGFDSRARRGLLPVTFVRFPDDEEISRNYYTATGAFMTILADALAENGIDIATASGLAGAALDRIVSRWKQISTSSLDILEGRETVELLCGFYQSARAGQPMAVCDDLEAIAIQMAEWKPLVRAVLVNVTRVASTMRERATKHDIDLSEFWRPDRYASGGGQ